MGLEYLNSAEIKDNKEKISSVLKKKSNYFVRENIVIDLVKKYSQPENKILEVGSGSGVLARALLENNYKNLSLVDIDNYLPSEIKEKVNFNIVDLSFDRLPFEDKSFDLILAIAIVEHLENPFMFFRESARVIKPGGKMLVAIPHIFAWQSRLKFLLKNDLIGYTVSNNHIALFTKSIFEKIVLKDFKIVEEKYSRGYVKLFSKKIKFNNKYFNKRLGTKSLYVLERKKYGN
ncbi:class I SAM-dependent methyltransferase [bacterium]|nr:class I SAM-dependent methyltransferase [bacterium]